jgi:hypothetical protein
MKTLHCLMAGLRPAFSNVANRIAIPSLVAGAALALVQPCGAAPFQWEETGSLDIARLRNTATLLSDGKVLVAGGQVAPFTQVASTELYDPATGTWAFSADMTSARWGHTATLLPNGKVLVASGFNYPNRLVSAELYDPASGTWTATGSLAEGHFAHTATLLPNGKVLVVGGLICELYDPASGTWTVTGSLHEPRGDAHTATLLPNGNVLVAGGFDLPLGDVIASAEVYDTANGTWAEVDSMAAKRGLHTATLLPNGKVLVAGGTDFVHTLRFAELYDPIAETWQSTGNLDTPRCLHEATLLPDGKVLVEGGEEFVSILLSSAELYDPLSGSWTTTGSLGMAREQHTATLLPNGRVLVATGFGGGRVGYLASAELYTSDAGGELTLVSAASRKNHGNAGPFDIDLPLTGTPGVECRVGNGGTFLQTIVFTFSEPVTSVSGTTTTTCGSVNSTTISGSTVTVELGHVNCDGSEITVTVPGVNGASGSVDASATMTLQTGDVNADGVVGTADLKEIRMNVGRGLVTEDNFRDDITVDGKVNHGDTTLEKSKL